MTTVDEAQRKALQEILEAHAETKESLFREMLQAVAPDALEDTASIPHRVRAEFSPTEEKYFVDNVLRLVMYPTQVTETKGGKYKLQFQYEKHYNEHEVGKNVTVH